MFVKYEENLNEIDIQNTETNQLDVSQNIISETKIEENSKDLFGEYYKKAEEQLKKMTLEEKVGQMFLVRYSSDGVVEEIKTESPGGYILFSRDFKDKTKESIKKELENNQAASKIPLVFGVDEEGGTVVRVSAHTAFRDTPFKSPQQVYRDGGMVAIQQDTIEKSRLLLSLGLNLNLAPVADVSTNASDFIYKRSFGKNANSTAEFVKTVVEVMNSEGISSCLKHFPGYGNNIDTHTGVAVDERTISVFEQSDFIPFKAGIESKVPVILVSHNIIKSMDKQYPASLSKNVHDKLREELGFSGIIITDDLAMDGVKSYVESGSAAVLAVNAGNDMIISSDFKTQKEEVLQAIKNGEISEDTINTAVKRILAWKYKYKIM